MVICTHTLCGINPGSVKAQPSSFHYSVALPICRVKWLDRNHIAGENPIVLALQFCLLMVLLPVSPDYFTPNPSVVIMYTLNTVAH